MEAKDRMINLCDYCPQNYPECSGSEFEYGDSVGNDNIIACDGYYESDETKEDLIMKDSVYTLKISLIPYLRNNLIPQGFKLEKKIPTRIRSEEKDGLNVFTKTFPKDSRDLITCWAYANKFMDENIIVLFDKETKVSAFHEIGYRYVGYYEVKELSDIVGSRKHSLEIWIK